MTDYIPKDDESFDDFQKNLVSQVTPIATASGIPAAQVTGLTAYQTAWTNAYAVGGKGEKTTRNSVQIKAKTEARKAYENSKAPQPLGLRAFIAAWVINNPLISNAQHVAMRIPVHKTNKTRHNVATKNTVVFKSTSLGGGVIQTDCHSSGSATLNPLAKTAKAGKKTNRDKKEEGYEIMKSWKIINSGDALPVTANDAGMTKTLFTKAKIIQQLGPENEGKKLCEFLQWYIPKHPELASPWSNMQTTIIT
jgi:hypothetical protein